ncbi:hypothetical protein D3C81_1325540 [compost metagenome]
MRIVSFTLRQNASRSASKLNGGTALRMISAFLFASLIFPIIFVRSPSSSSALHLPISRSLTPSTISTSSPCLALFSQPPSAAAS